VQPRSSITIRIAGPADFAAVAALLTAVYLGEGYSAPAIEPWLRDVAARAAKAEFRLLAVAPALRGPRLRATA
jgi:hypothetical protein